MGGDQGERYGEPVHLKVPEPSSREVCLRVPVQNTSVSQPPPRGPEPPLDSAQTTSFGCPYMFKEKKPTVGFQYP